MPTSSVDSFLPRGILLKVNQESVENGTTIESNWKKATGHSSVVGYFVADTGGAAANAEVTIEQTLDEESPRTVDITNTVSPTAEGAATPFEFPLVGDFVKVTFQANETIGTVHLTSYRSTRVEPL